MEWQKTNGQFPLNLTEIFCGNCVVIFKIMYIFINFLIFVVKVLVVSSSCLLSEASMGMTIHGLDAGQFVNTV